MSETAHPEQTGEGLTFWDHLDELRSVIIRILVITVLAAIVAFCLKDELFAIVLAPRTSDFITYRLMGVETFSIHLMNTGLTEQFMIHMKTALYAGMLVASPYIIYQLFRFVSPALYDNERKYATALVASGYGMFMLGTALNYLLIFPLTVRFLGTYQVSPDVANMLTLQSYMDTLIMMSLVMGVVFELPVVSWLLGKMGLVNRPLMRTWRKHAVVAILVVSAIITPTTDAFTLFVVALPIWLLYELSILIVKSE
jgi:sec-independent protein translocase protein TatC